MQAFLDALVSRLPTRVQEFAKALVPTLVAVIVILQDFVISVEEVNELGVLASGLVTSIFVYVVRNVVPPPVPVVEDARSPYDDV